MTNISRGISPPEDYILLNSYLYVAIERLSYAYLCMYVTWNLTRVRILKI